MNYPLKISRQSALSVINIMSRMIKECSCETAQECANKYNFQTALAKLILKSQKTADKKMNKYFTVNLSPNEVVAIDQLFYEFNISLTMSPFLWAIFNNFLLKSRQQIINDVNSNKYISLKIS